MCFVLVLKQLLIRVKKTTTKKNKSSKQKQNKIIFVFKFINIDQTFSVSNFFLDNDWTFGSINCSNYCSILCCFHEISAVVTSDFFQVYLVELRIFLSIGN